MDSRKREADRGNGFIIDRSPVGSSSSSASHHSESSDNGPADSGLSTPSKSFHPTFRGTSRYPSQDSSAQQLARERESHNYFRSRRINKEDIQQPWKAVKDPREKWVTIIPVIGILVGLIFSGFFIWNGLRTVVRHQYKLVLDEDFSRGLDPSVWTKESNVGGFGSVMLCPLRSRRCKN